MTLDEVNVVLARLAAGERVTDIAKVLGLSQQKVSKIKNGWRPVGRSAVKLTPSLAKQRGER